LTFKGISVQKKYLTLLLAGSLPLFFGAVAHAQTVEAKPSAAVPAAADDDSSYQLKGVAPKPSGSAAQQAATANYELRGTSISGAYAATQTILTAPVEPNAAAYKTESGVYLYPSAFVGYGYNSNVATASTNAAGSGFINMAPELVAELKNRGDRYTAAVAMNATRYFDSAADNYTNSDLQVAGDNYFSSRARAGWSVGYVNGSDPRGSNNRPVGNEPDRWHSANLNARLIYGAQEAPGRFEIDLGNQAKSYDNNRENTAVADVNVGSYAGRFFYRLGTKTMALVEYRNARANYTSSLATDSNVERRYYAGLTWEATAATTGIVKIGQMTKDFDQAGRSAYNGGSWEASVRWLPLSYSMVEFSTNRSASDPVGFGSYQLNTATNLTWSHKWTSFLTSRAGLGLLSTGYSDVGASRTDNTTNTTFTLEYQVLRWLKMGVDIGLTDRSSNVTGADFKRNITMFTLNATL
jgi:hypothetical protein